MIEQSSQAAAIKTAAKLGVRLQIEHPEVAELYRRGFSYRRIQSHLSIPELYGTTEAVALNAARCAIAGYAGGLGIEQYDGIIALEELKTLEQAHQKENQRAAKENKLGIWGLSKEQLKRTGKKALEQKLGVHSFTHEELREASALGSIARGYIQWTEEEIQDAVSMSQSPEYQHHSGRVIGRPNMELIAQVLNSRYHNNTQVRKPKSVTKQIYRQRKLATSSPLAAKAL